jgi:hypothetical protein
MKLLVLRQFCELLVDTEICERWQHGATREIEKIGVYGVLLRLDGRKKRCLKIFFDFSLFSSFSEIFRDFWFLRVFEHI